MGLFDKIATLLKQNEKFAVATIVERRGSAPRDMGTRMLIHADGAITGTIGGGILEARVQQLAAEIITQRISVVEQFSLSREETSSMGMICGGGVRVLIQFMDAADPYWLKLYQALADAQKRRRKAWLVTAIPGAAPLAQFLISADGNSIVTEREIPWKDIIPTSGQTEIVTRQGVELLIEPLYDSGVVYIFGAGHISQKLAPLTRMMGFNTVVLDDRKEFANRELFAGADEVWDIKDFESAMAHLKAQHHEMDQDSYVVIVTRGHAHDKTILAQALKTPAGYIGMIGSRRKRDDIYAALLEEGYTETDLERVYSPIGLAIGAETPEEIALSITAELVQKRARKKDKYIQVIA